MNEIVNCPACGRPLRVTEELLGAQVRCPACRTIFDAVAPEEASRQRPEEQAPAGPPGLQGAVEIKGEGSAAEPVSRPPPAARREEDEESCPTCGRPVEPDDRRCWHCGERLGRSRRDPREPLVRRDSEPHRGVLVLVLGILALVLVFLPPIGVLLGIVAWVMGHGDLGKIRAGTMDPEGEGSTQAGRVCGIVAVGLNTLSAIACVAWITWMINLNYNAPPIPRWTPPRPPPAVPRPMAPPAQPRPPQKW